MLAPDACMDKSKEASCRRLVTNSCASRLNASSTPSPSLQDVVTSGRSCKSQRSYNGRATAESEQHRKTSMSVPYYKCRRGSTLESAYNTAGKLHTMSHYPFQQWIMTPIDELYKLVFHVRGNQQYQLLFPPLVGNTLVPPLGQYHTTYGAWLCPENCRDHRTSNLA